jgi:hypothetical protein
MVSSGLLLLLAAAFLVVCITYLLPWRRKQYVPPKCRRISAQRHNTTPQKDVRCETLKRNVSYFVRFEYLVAVAVNGAVVGCMIRVHCNLIEVYGSFGRKYCLHLQGQRKSPASKVEPCSVVEVYRRFGGRFIPAFFGLFFEIEAGGTTSLPDYTASHLSR